jgi:hypothetical protein
MMEYSFHPCTGAEPCHDVKVEAAGQFAARMKEIEDEVKAALEKAADDMVQFYDVHRKVAPEYQVGDQVWLDGRDLQTMWLAKKLDYKWYGPYKIE